MCIKQTDIHLKMPPKKVQTPIKRVTSKTVWKEVVYKLVHNILKNAMYVMDACNCRTLSDTHLKAVSLIQTNIMSHGFAYVPSNTTHKGGAVLPSEYFGHDSGRYMDISKVNMNEVQLFSDSSLVRAAHPIKMPSQTGAGRSASKGPTVLPSHVKGAIKAFEESNNGLARVSKEAVDLIIIAVQENINDIARKVGNSPTQQEIATAIGTFPDLMHLKI